jgi:hypothetical protein
VSLPAAIRIQSLQNHLSADTVPFAFEFIGNT